MAKGKAAKPAAKKAPAAESNTKRPLGNQTTYTPEIADEVCRRLADGETLPQICRDEHIPAASTIRGWALDDREDFAARYARARDLGLDAMADETIEIADDSRNDWIERETAAGRLVRVVDVEAVQRSRVRIDARRWLLSKLKPERYGDSLKLTGGLDLSHKTDDQLQARLAQLLGEARGDRDSGGNPAEEESA